MSHSRQSIPQVAELANRIYLVEEGEIVFSGDRRQALSNETLREALLGM